MPATAEHAYIAAKGGTPYGLRVVPEGDTLTIASQQMAGALVVPVMPLAGGEPVSLQFIPPPGGGRKLNLPNAPMDGVFTVGQPAAEKTTTKYIVEGIGQGWACSSATGHSSVVCFGSGRMRNVAAELRQQDATVRLVVVPDVGKEANAEAIAAEVGGQYVVMPDGWKENDDVNDLARLNGLPALSELLATAIGPAPRQSNPLTQYVPLDGKPKVPTWVIPGFIESGVVMIAGTHGVGKTTALLPLAMVAAGLHQDGDPLAPRHWRHVVYVTEDVEQAKRILFSIVEFSKLSLITVRERFHIVNACRMQPDAVAEASATYKASFSRQVHGVEVLPLVVFDTKSAVFNMEDENSNSEASKIVAMLKQDFNGLPVWLIGHLSKINANQTDPAAMSSRGGGAFDADANQCLFLVEEKGTRYLKRGKTRFEARWAELVINSSSKTMMASNEFGDQELITLRWAIASPPERSRHEDAERYEAQALREANEKLQCQVLEVVNIAWLQGEPLNRTGLKLKIGGNSGKSVDCIGALIKEGWLHEITVPPQERTNSKRSAFLIALDKPEHDAWVIGSVLPEKKQVIPPSWKKSAPQGIVGAISSTSIEPERNTAQELELQQEVLIPSVPIPSVP